MSVNLLYNYPADQGTDLKVQSIGLQSKTSAQINALTATPGQLVFNSDTDNMEYYDGADWNQIYSSAPGSLEYCYFRAHLSSPQVITAINTTISFDTIDENVYNGQTGGLSTDQFNAPTPGVYQFNFTTTLSGFTGTVTEPNVTIIKNLSDIIATTPNGTFTTSLSNSNELFYSLSGITQLDAGDIVRVLTSATGISPGVNEYAVATNTYFSGALITRTPYTN